MNCYGSKLIKNYATITDPLKKLTHTITSFTWASSHQTAYEELNNALINSPEISPFDKSKETSVDARPVGLSAILTQKDPNTNADNIIAYAGRALFPDCVRYRTLSPLFVRSIVHANHRSQTSTTNIQ